MPRLAKLVQHPLGRGLLFGLLIIGSLAYVVTARNFLYSTVFSPTSSISEHDLNTNPAAVLAHWTVASMDAAANDDLVVGNTSDVAPENSDTTKGKAAQQDGHAPSDGSLGYPFSTVGKIFFSDSSGQNYVCSGTAIESLNHNTVDTAGHCLYWHNNWMQNVIFCPLYDRGNTPFGCWAARALEVPADWINRKLTDLHHDFGMIIVSPNSSGDLTDAVGGAGWAYNQSTNQAFYAYGYPAGSPFDGQTRQSCDKGSVGQSWKHGGGTVISIPCNMTGGSSGGPWFIKSGGKWYLNGHNDFTSSLKYGHMFSPYYEDTWYALYNKAQHT
jgi:V8-like Glu-specific endopeptidase